MASSDEQYGSHDRLGRILRTTISEVLRRSRRVGEQLEVSRQCGFERILSIGSRESRLSDRVDDQRQTCVGAKHVGRTPGSGIATQ